ncbi:MAG: heavy-metal-associated domain-containing protein [Planctomycetota bacterium]|nr:MAG: heavy-metal-associated domain-containing protein [Planctomycetota bacterium]
MRLKIDITGMHCDHCVRAVRDRIGSLPGVGVERLTVGEAIVELDETLTPKADLFTAIRRAGDYDVAGFMVIG